MPLTKLKIAVFEPTASAIVTIATAANPGTIAQRAQRVTNVVTNGHPTPRAPPESGPAAR